MQFGHYEFTIKGKWNIRERKSLTVGLLCARCWTSLVFNVICPLIKVIGAISQPLCC